MPNYKVFQDYADSMRVKIYGIDDANNTTPLLTNASGKLDIVGAVEFSGQVSGTVTVSGQVSGVVDIGSGSVKVTSGVAVSGISNVSGSALYVRGAVVDSGPVSSGVSGSISGAFGGTSWDVLGYAGWTFAVKYSGNSGADVNARLQISATGSTDDWINVDPLAASYSGTTWNLFTTTYQLRYARIFITNSGADGDMHLYFQAQY